MILLANRCRVSDAETEQTAYPARGNIQDRSLVVLWSNDMEFVRNLDCVVSVLHDGSVIAKVP